MTGLPDLDKLPWKSYQTKQLTTNPKEAAWIWANARGAEALAEQMKQHNGKVSVSGMEYMFSGQTQQFISRKPSK